MIIRSSDQVPRVTALKRFPVSRDFGVQPESRIMRERTWPAPASATRVKALEVYRYDPDSEGNPRLDASPGAFGALAIWAAGAYHLTARLGIGIAPGLVKAFSALASAR